MRIADSDPRRRIALSLTSRPHQNTTWNDVMQSLESRIAVAGSAYRLLHDSAGLPFVFPLAPEFTNWRDEQNAWRKTAILQDMSLHMFNMVIDGPDTSRLLADYGVNSFASFGPMQAKQYVVCNAEGQYIGDAILTCEVPNNVCLVGKPLVLNWLRFHLEMGKYDAKVVHFGTPSSNLSGQRLYRYQVQGPNALSLFEDIHGGPIPDIGFFKMGKLKVAGREVTALNHRMSGAPGFEIWGPAEQGAEIKEAILTVGARHGLRQIGGKVFRVTAAESGWVATALPAIYTGESTRDFREWLPADSFEANSSIGGSFPRGNLEELYVTPYDIGYGFMIKFDHDFCGSMGLEAMKGKPRRKKVRLLWNSADVLAVQASMYGDSPRYKYMDMPVADYASFLSDEVSLDGKRVGLSYHPVYSVAARAWISLAVVDEEVVNSGREVVVTWGEPNGGSGRPSVETHVQCSIRAMVEANAVRRD